VSGSGIATLDFGAFPGKSDASLAITGQAGILSNSLVEAWLRPEATADHTADEHMVETLKIFAGNIIAGTGFTIYGLNNSEIIDQSFSGGRWPPYHRDTIPVNRGSLIYGLWTVAWVWN
jgi:hypothetical protein